MVTAMTGDRARSALRTTRFADVRWVAETGSTNRDLLALAAAGGADGTVLVADHQTAGRGRLDRTWQAPPGGSLLVSVLFRLGLGTAEAHLLTTAVGVSAVEACRAVVAVPAQLKWPNDVVVVGAAGARKVGGILAETIVEGDQLAAVVVGLGLNVVWPVALPAELAQTAVALNHLVGDGPVLDREMLLVGVLERLDHWTARILEGGGDGRAALMDRARELSATLGREVRVDLGREVLEGRAVELGSGGELVVSLPSGERRTVVVGDVVHVRPSA